MEKPQIRTHVNSYLKAKVQIKEKEMAKELIHKRLFLDSILLLKEIEDRRDFMEAEFGLDMSIYEEKFLQIIENLFKMNFNKEQMSLIQYYLYTTPTIEDWDGTILLSDGKDTMSVEFETPEQVWNVITSILKADKK